MKWSIRELRIKASEPMMLDETLDIKEALLNKHTEMIDAGLFKVTGMILYEEQTVLMQLQVSGQVVLPSTRSLTPVEVPMAFDINERLMAAGSPDDIVDDEAVIPLELFGETIDLDKTVTDNILTHLPLQVYTEEEQKGEGFASGNDWQVLSESQVREKHKDDAETVDPRFAALGQLFNDDAQD